jgi:hypothetical protein
LVITLDKYYSEMLIELECELGKSKNTCMAANVVW